FSTHPPTRQRIRILQAMAGKAGFVDYEAAFHQVQGQGRSCLDQRTVDSEGSLEARPATPGDQPVEDDAVTRAREVGNLLGRIGQFLYLPCACGVNIKVPPDFPGETVACPRCGAVHEVPRAKPQAAPEKTAPGSGE